MWSLGLRVLPLSVIGLFKVMSDDQIRHMGMRNGGERERDGGEVATMFVSPTCRP